jgi:EF-P beta-lysylation protein EpmB
MHQAETGSKNLSPSWSESLKRAIRSGEALLAALSLPKRLACAESEADFPVFVPLEYFERMQPGNPCDPLLLQVLGSHQEVSLKNPGKLDPVGDQASELIPGLLKKYSGRALLIVSGACAVHCRYCFRRHFPYDQAPVGPVGWQASVAAIAADDSIQEVILSGGDPLSVRDSSMQWLIESIDAIPHLQRVRIHTRFPVMIPNRICGSLLHWVSHARCAVYFVLHFNHAAEINQPVRQAMRRLRLAGATLLNQSVLLRGVNDSAAAQHELCRSLVDMQVLPYYLHQLDPVQGGMHFEVSDGEALQIIAELRRTLPGYGVPQLVREIAGQPHKVPVEMGSSA